MNERFAWRFTNRTTLQFRPSSGVPFVGTERGGSEMREVKLHLEFRNEPVLDDARTIVAYNTVVDSVLVDITEPDFAMLDSVVEKVLGAMAKFFAISPSKYGSDRNV